MKNIAFSKSIATLFTLALLSSPSFAGDWTPLLKGMQNSCQVEEKIHQIIKEEQSVPKALQTDIIKRTINYKTHDAKGKEKIISEKECGNVCVKEIKMTLKNATAFGLPINEISASYILDYQNIAVKFTNKGYEKILPQFKFTNGKKSWRYGQYFVTVYDMKTDKSFKIPFKDIEQYRHEIHRYFIDILSKPEYIEWYDGVSLFYNFGIEKNKNTLVCAVYSM